MNPLTAYRSIYLTSCILKVKRSRAVVGALNHLNVVAPQMGERDRNMGNDRRTRRTGRRKEEGAMNSLFCPQLEDHIARI